jgi:hypothetical protein
MANTPVTDPSSNSINSAILEYQNSRLKAVADLENNAKTIREAVTKMMRTHRKNETICNDAFQKVMDLLPQSDESNRSTLPPSEHNRSELRH